MVEGELSPYLDYFNFLFFTEIYVPETYHFKVDFSTVDP